MLKIDSHHHFWDFDPQAYAWIGENMSVLRRDFGPKQLDENLRSSNISAAISVQARQTVEETEWLIQLAELHQAFKTREPKTDSEVETYSCVAGVVGWVPLVNERVDTQLDRLHRHSVLRGVRHVVHDEPDDNFILRDDFNRGVSRLDGFGLAYDILIFAKHLPMAIEFVDRHPNQRFILDHIAKPTIRASAFDQTWADRFKELARRQNVYCKFSGVVTEIRDADWTIETIKPYWDTAIEAFGIERLMFGSDWPVCLLRSSYEKWIDVVTKLSGELSVDEQERFWGLNAAEAYSLIF